MTSVGHCGLEELVPILKRTIGEEQEFWVASPTSKILKLTQTHFTFSTFSLSLVVRTYINWLWRKKFNVLFRLYSCHKRKKCACVSCIRPVFLPWPRNYFLGAEYHCQLGIGDNRPNFHLWWITQTENLLIAHHPDSIWWSSYLPPVLEDDDDHFYHDIWKHIICSSSGCQILIIIHMIID